MSALLLWVGLTLLVGLPVVLNKLAIGGSDLSVLIGGILMVIGAVIMVLDWNKTR